MNTHILMLTVLCKYSKSQCQCVALKLKILAFEMLGISESVLHVIPVGGGLKPVLQYHRRPVQIDSNKFIQ